MADLQQTGAKGSLAKPRLNTLDMGDGRCEGYSALGGQLLKLYALFFGSLAAGGLAAWSNSTIGTWVAEVSSPMALAADCKLCSHSGQE